MPARRSCIPRLFADAPDGRVLAEPAVRPRHRGRAALRRAPRRALDQRRDAGGDRRRRSGDRRQRRLRAMATAERLHHPARRAVPRHARRGAPRRPADRRLRRRTTRSRSPTSRSTCRPAAPPAPSARAFCDSSAGRCSCRGSARSATSTRTRRACSTSTAPELPARRRPHGAAARADQAGARLVGRAGARRGGACPTRSWSSPPRPPMRRGSPPRSPG